MTRSPIWGWLFAEQTLSALGLARITLSLATLYNLVLWVPTLPVFFGSRALFDRQAAFAITEHPVSLLWIDHPLFPWLVWGLAVTGALILLSGRASRLGALVTVCALTVFQFRCYWALNGGDTLLRMLLVWFLFLPAGRSGFDGGGVAKGIPFAQRMIQLQVFAMYFSTMQWKLLSPRWRDGTAVHNALSNPEWAQSGAELLIQWPTITWILGMGALIAEILLPFLLWSRRTRVLAFGLGLCVHGFIGIFLSIPSFGVTAMCAYPAFLTEDEVAWLLRRFR